MRSWILAVSFACAFVSAGCAPQIGDSCSTALDCSLTGDRVCDVSTEGGQCIVFGCEPDTCPSESECVRFRPQESRLSYTACMKRCSENGNCRVDEGYACVAAGDLMDPLTGEPLAEVTEDEVESFCVATVPPTP
jgi:hypothetical protein